jgi:hypothetical protein
VKAVVALTQTSSVSKPETTKAKAADKKELPSLARKSTEVLDDLTARARIFIREAHHYSGGPAAEIAGLGPQRRWNGDEESSVKAFRQSMEAALRLTEVEKQFGTQWSRQTAKVIPAAHASENVAPIWCSIIAWAAADALGHCCDIEDPEVVSAQIFDALRMREVMAEAFAAAGATGDDRWRAAARIRASFAHAPWAPAVEESRSRSSAVFSWLHDPDVAWLIGVHEYKGERYFNKESFEEFLWWMSLRALLTASAEKVLDAEKIAPLEKEIQSRLKAAADAGYRVEALLQSGAVRQPSGTLSVKDQTAREETIKK